MTDLETCVLYFNIFKETAVNNIGIIHGFKSWVNKMNFVINGSDLVIRIPPVLVNHGSYDYIKRSRRKQEIDTLMEVGKPFRSKTYTYLDFVIKMTNQKFAAQMNSQVTKFYKKGAKKNGRNK